MSNAMLLTRLIASTDDVGARARGDVVAVRVFRSTDVEMTDHGGHGEWRHMAIFFRNE